MNDNCFFICWSVGSISFCNNRFNPVHITLPLIKNEQVVFSNAKQ
jgi:hypothetical protein